MFFKNLHFLTHTGNIDDRSSALIFKELNPNPHPHLESAFGLRIPDADPGDQNHADSCGCGCGCGSATLLSEMGYWPLGIMFFLQKNTIIAFAKNIFTTS
jgi:hypothetical protein